MEKIVIADGTAYKDWITEITDEFRKSQIRAAVKINAKVLLETRKRYIRYEQPIWVRIWIL